MQDSAIAFSPSLSLSTHPRKLFVRGFNPLAVSSLERQRFRNGSAISHSTRRLGPISCSLKQSGWVFGSNPGIPEPGSDGVVVRATTEGVGPVGSPKLKNLTDTLVRGSLFGLWYLFNIYFNIYNKQRKKNGGKCSRVDLMLASRTRKSKKAVNASTLENNTLAVDEINKLKEQRDQGLNDKTDEQIIQEVLGKDTHGYLKAYGPGRSITQHFKVKPSRLDLSQDVNEVKKKADQAIEEARKDAENARTKAEKTKIEAEQAQKEAEAIRNDVDKKIADNNEVREKKFSQLPGLSWSRRIFE